ncbi:MAG: hypothetical protein ABW094_06485 [Candidatus Thiodiazotropha sp.]
MDSDSFVAGIVFAALMFAFAALGLAIGADNVESDCEDIGRILINEEVYSCKKESLN